MSCALRAHFIILGLGEKKKNNTKFLLRGSKKETEKILLSIDNIVLLKRNKILNSGILYCS